MTPPSVWSGTYSGSPSPRITLVRSKMNFSWLRGIPIMSTMIRSGRVAAMSVTKSPSPRSMIVVDDPGGGGLDVTLHLVELPGREAARHDPAHARVLRVVHVDHRPEELEEVRRHVADVRAAPRAEELRVLARLEHVGVPGERVVAGARRDASPAPAPRRTGSGPPRAASGTRPRAPRRDGSRTRSPRGRSGRG